MRIECIVQKHIASSHAKAPSAATFFIRSGEHECDIGEIVPVARNSRAAFPAFMTVRNARESTHHVLSRNDQEQSTQRSESARKPRYQKRWLYRQGAGRVKIAKKQ